MSRAHPGAELDAATHVDRPAGTEMASSSLAGLLNRNHRDPHGASAERGSARKKGEYAQTALSDGDDALNDDFYDEQLRSDGWHLDETSDDEQLDFSLPKALPSKAQSSACECAPNSATLRRIRARAMQQCALM
ncbi:hypothetical protein KFE25_010460 [Diacronema lutheri]|uniref:Uncharacterized protein n=2 Tax=Diacronema lutheri TaxID=2081491 RepID=A0A8J6CBA5_DIALT|nr:hypothetical protein KFE25_010460 [Diacronema lutheri]